MKRIALLMVLFITFIGCENDAVWNLPRPNPNDLYNVCYEYNCDSLGEIAIGNWQRTNFGKDGGGALRSSREPGEYIQILYPSSTNSILSFWISNWDDYDDDTTVLTNGEILQVYINNVKHPIHVVKKEFGCASSCWWKVSTDVFQVTSPSKITIYIPPIFDGYERQFASKPEIDEIEINCR